ncbi:MAG TPA: DMT family transporter [Planctomycetota bacterium]|nr:DMT family transporter [Planctomycetota bacterium]
MGRAYAAITVVTILWGINFTVGRRCTQLIDPFFIASFRIIVTGLFFYALLPREERRIQRSDWKLILPLSVSGILTNHVCFAWGISQTRPSHSAIIHAIFPVFVAIVAWMVLRERQGPLALLGMAVAVAGALVVVVGAARDEVARTLAGDLISAVGVLSFSFYTVFGRKAVQVMSSRRVVTLAFLMAAPMLVPFLILGIVRQPRPWREVGWEGWLELAYMLVFANMVAYLLHSYALRRLSAGQVAAFTDLQPALGIGVAVLAREDQMTGTLAAGAAIALVGVVLVQLRR